MTQKELASKDQETARDLSKRLERAYEEIARLRGVLEAIIVLCKDCGKKTDCCSCSVCGKYPARRIKGTYWLCSPCQQEIYNIPQYSLKETL